MFASRAFSGLQGSGRNSLDVPVAALAGLAVAFVAFAAPANLLADLVGATGLPSILPAAEPPLGMTARLGLGAGGALIAFAIAFLLLRWLGRFGARRAEEAEEEEILLETPRLRRRDIHPDAPARPPLLAVHELGEPELELNEVEPEAPAPWLEPAAPVTTDYAPQPAPQPQPWAVETQEPAPEPSDPSTSSQAEAYALSQRIWSAEPDAETFEPQNGAPDEPVETERFDEAWGFEPMPAEPPVWTDDSEAPAPAQPEPVAQEWEAPATAEPEPQIVAADTAGPWPIAEETQPEVAEPAPETPPAHAPGSIADLMERLELGLARRRLTPPEQAEPAPASQFLAPESSEPPAPDNDRLQNAIESLQRFASRQD